MRVLLQKHLGALRPVDEAGQEALRSVKHGEIVSCEVKRPRNVQHHRLYFALLSVLLENQSRYQTVEELNDAIKCAVGHCTIITRGDGYEIRIPKSISFSRMGQDEFSAFFERVVDLAVTRILPNVNRADLKAQIEEMVR